MKHFFPTDENEIKILEFLGKYQFILKKDIYCFFEKNNTYYPKRITKMIKLGLIKRYKDTIVLASAGKQFLKLKGIKINESKYTKSYIERLRNISHIGAITNTQDNISFVPSFELKENLSYAESSRRYLGIIKINRINYIFYIITKEHSDKYVSNIKYDILKGNNFNCGIIIFIDDRNRIDLNSFSCGSKNIFLINNLDELNNLNKIDTDKLVKEIYGNKVCLSQYSFCDYIYKDKYISLLEIIDIEKINRIEMFCKNNPKKAMEIITTQEFKEFLNLNQSNLTFKIIEFTKYIIKDKVMYD